MSSLALQVLAARSTLHVCSEPQLVYLLLRARTSVPTQTRMPLNLCLVLDRSSSMRGERLYQVKQAARQIIDQLDRRDSFSVVVFNDRAEVVLPAQSAKDPEALWTAISTVEASGGTEMAQGLVLGLQEIERPKTVALSRLILLTDGRTYGDEQSCIDLARRAQSQGIGLTTLGIGTEWNEDLLETMTAGPRSRTLYITATDEIVPVFTTEFERLHRTIGHTVEFTLHTHPATEVRSCYRAQPFVAPLPPRAYGNGRWSVPVGEWVADEDQVVMLELLVPPVPAGTHPIAHIEASYVPVGTSLPQTAAANVQLPATEHGDRSVDPDARRVLERIVAYQQQSRAWQAVAEGRSTEASRRLQVAGTHLFNAGEAALARTVQAEASQLVQGRAASADGRKRIKYGTRGLLA